jgi:hypothetical protein
MSQPVKTAFCPLFFASNGGQFNSLGMPMFGGRQMNYEDGADTPDTEEDENGDIVRLVDPFAVASNCDRAFDCGTCHLIHQWVNGKISEGWAIGWECDDCLHEWKHARKHRPDLEWQLAGFYQSGVVPEVGPEDDDYDPDKTICDGCTSCGRSSSFLQLILRRPRR